MNVKSVWTQVKSTLNWLYATLGFFGVAIALMIAIQWYKRMRNK